MWFLIVDEIAFGTGEVAGASLPFSRRPRHHSRGSVSLSSSRANKERRWSRSLRAEVALAASQVATQLAESTPVRAPTIRSDRSANRDASETPPYRKQTGIVIIRVSWCALEILGGLDKNCGL